MGKRHHRHPEAVAREQAERAAARSRVPMTGWQHDEGWLLVLYSHTSRAYRDLPPGTTHAEAQELRRRELRANPEFYKAWLIRKPVS